MNGRLFTLEVGKPEFHLIFSRQDKAIILAWCAETQLANVVWLRMVVIRWGFPPIKITDTFLVEGE